MEQIQYVIGDTTEPIGEGAKIIAHVCNDVGLWGAGFTRAISAKWREPEQTYRKFYGTGDLRLRGVGLGTIQMVQVEPTIMVCNMIAQRSVRTAMNPTPIRYGHLETCLGELSNRAQVFNSSVHMPRIGCGLAGGAWEIVEVLIQKQLIDQGIDVTVYDLLERPLAA